MATPPSASSPLPAPTRAPAPRSVMGKAPPPMSASAAPQLPPLASNSAEKIDVGDDPKLGGSAEPLGAPSRPRFAKTKTIIEDDDKFCRKLIHDLMKPKIAVKGHFHPFTYADVAQLLKAAKKIFEAEPAMIQMKLPAAIVGDLHGQYIDLARIFDIFHDADTNVPGYVNHRYVFLGDYVDRGRQSLEIIMCLFALKVLFPAQFALLRGNHECRAINRAYGFAAEIRERFLDPRRSQQIFEDFNEVFTHLPLSCIVGGHILCMHGGISSKMRSRDDLIKIPKPLKDVSKEPVATDLLWADPMIGLEGEIPNKVRGVSVYFGEDTLDKVLVALDISLIVRGHQMMMNGFNLYNNKLVTVFSASAYYPEKPNRGAIVTVDKNGRVGFKCLIPSTKAQNIAEGIQPKLFRGEHDVANDHDTGYVKQAKTPEQPKSGPTTSGKKPAA